MWQFACRRVIKVGERVAKDFMSAGASRHVLIDYDTDFTSDSTESTSASLEEVPGEASTDKAKVQ